MAPSVFPWALLHNFFSLEYSNFPPALVLHALHYAISGQNPRQYELLSLGVCRAEGQFLKILRNTKC